MSSQEDDAVILDLNQVETQDLLDAIWEEYYTLPSEERNRKKELRQSWRELAKKYNEKAKCEVYTWNLK